MLLAVVETLAIIVLTWKYVRIYADLLVLNRESLDALKESVISSREMAEIMRKQTAIAEADSAGRIVREHEPFRHLIARMVEGVQRVLDTDLVHVYHEALNDQKPQTSWFIPADYREKVAVAQNLDGKLHALLAGLYEQPNGPLSQLHGALGEVGRAIRVEVEDVSHEGRTAVDEAQRYARAALVALLEILAYVNEHEEWMSQGSRQLASSK